MMRWLCCERCNKLFQKEKKRRGYKIHYRYLRGMLYDRSMAATNMQSTIILIIPSSSHVKAYATLGDNGLPFPEILPKSKTQISIRLWFCPHIACYLDELSWLIVFQQAVFSHRESPKEMLNLQGYPPACYAIKDSPR